MRGRWAIILDILNLIGRFFKFGMETKQFRSRVTGKFDPVPKWTVLSFYHDFLISSELPTTVTSFFVSCRSGTC